MMASNKFLKCNNQVDYHRRRMGQNQKFKSIKIRKESKRVRFMTLEDKVRHEMDIINTGMHLFVRFCCAVKNREKMDIPLANNFTFCVNCHSNFCIVWTFNIRMPNS